MQLACAENDLLLDYYIGNHVAFVAATQEQAFGMTADKMQNYLKNSFPRITGVQSLEGGEI